MYWPGLNDQLEKLILNCELCLKYSHSKCKPKPTTSLGQEIPVHPWSKFASDIFHLLIVDYTSRFLIVCKLTSVTGICVANQCMLVFSTYGWPDTCIPDNGPWYTSQSVMQAFSVNHITSSLHYLQSNILAEKYVQIVKCLFNKAKEEGKDFYKCLMIYYNTPLQVACSHLCRFYKEEVLDLTCQCPMQLKAAWNTAWSLQEHWQAWKVTYTIYM